MTLRTPFALIVCLIAFSPALRAQACDFAYKPEPERQRALWDQSATVYLARIDRLRPREWDRLTARRGVLVPIRVLKGAGSVPRVPVQHNAHITSCGLSPSALESNNGEMFIVFAASSGASIEQDSIIETLPPFRLEEDFKGMLSPNELQRPARGSRRQQQPLWQQIAIYPPWLWPVFLLAGRD